MAQPILVVKRVTRIADKEVELFELTNETASKEAGIGRGLMIGNCVKNRLSSHVSFAVSNCLPAQSVVVPFSYDLSSEIADRISEDRGVDIWMATRNSRKGEGPLGATVQIAIPEKLFLIEKRIREGLWKAEFIHVVDPSGRLDATRVQSRNEVRSRGTNIARHKAVCEANGRSPYVIYWTCGNCGSFTHLHLCGLMGVDAWLYADGKTVRTAAFRGIVPGESGSRRKRSHWLDEWVHKAFVSGCGVVVVCRGTKESAESPIRELADLRGYPVVSIAKLVGRVGVPRNEYLEQDVLKVFRKSVWESNRQVTILTDADFVWRALGEETTLRLLLRQRGLTTVVVGAPSDRTKKVVSAAAARLLRKRITDFEPVIVDGSE